MVRFLLGSCVAALALAALMLAGRHMRAGGHVRAWEARLDELRARARPASDRVDRGPEAEALRQELVELDRGLQTLCEKQDLVLKTPNEALTSAELERHRAWVASARPVLDRWLHVEPCATPPGDAPADTDWLPLRLRVEARLARGERIATESPRFMYLRAWSRLLAWHAWFEAQSPPEHDGFALVGPADVLASIFPLASAFDDGSLIGAVVRVALEAETLQTGRALLGQDALTARELRAALDPWLVRSNAVQPRELVEGELFWFLERSLEPVLPGGTAKSGTEADLLLQYFGDFESTFELARVPWAKLEEHRRTRPDASGFANACGSALETLHRHRSIVALARVALALEEHRERNGTLPASLADLAPLFPDGLPTDPLTGSPFPYAVDDSHVRLGPTACPEHGDDEDRNLDWTAAVERLAAWEL